jgi:hypothetical protein
MAAGCVDLVLSPAEIGGELARIARHPHVAGKGLFFQEASHPSGEDDHALATAHEGDRTALPSGGQGTPPTGAEQSRAEADRPAAGRYSSDAGGGRAAGLGDDGEGYRRILSLLHDHSGVDFSL